MEPERQDVRFPPFMMSARLREAVDTWRFANRIQTRAEAVRRLIEAGLKDQPQLPAPPR
jgi:hypothetical protein